MSLRAFARRKQVNEGQVRKAIRTGRLERAVRRIQGRPVIVDVALADREWDENPDPARALAAGRSARSSPVATARRRVLELQAAKLEQDLAATRDALVKELKAHFSARIITARNHLLGLPARARQRLPHLSTQDLTVLEAIVRDALDELAEGLAPAVPSA